MKSQVNTLSVSEGNLKWKKIEEEITKEWGDNYKIIGYWVWENTLKDVAGKILTIIDASYPEGTQRKAIKDLVKQCISKTILNIQEDYWKGKQGDSVQIEEVE